MNSGVIIIVVVGVVVVLGVVAALLWWRLADKAAPYQDGSGRGGRPAKGRDHDEVVVIRDDDGPSREKRG